MTEKQIHLAGRIDQLVRDYFEKHNTVNEIPAKELMSLFIDKGIFKKDHRDGLPIRNLLRVLDAGNKLSFIHNLQVNRKAINRNWYFVRKK